MAQADPAKWTMPGWRIEQRYANGVLIGNWNEERLQFQKGNLKHNSTYRIDYKDDGSSKPDVIIRRKALIRNDGLGKELLFYHHGNRYSNNMISWYDEHYNKRERDENNRLPELRHWDSKKLAWVPEKTDYPIQGAPTNFGLKEKLFIEQMKRDSEFGGEEDYNTTYNHSYSCFPYGAMARTRYGTPKSISTSLHRANAINKNMPLRGKMQLQSPEILPNVEQPPAAPVVES